MIIVGRGKRHVQAKGMNYQSYTCEQSSVTIDKLRDQRNIYIKEK